MSDIPDDVVRIGTGLLGLDQVLRGGLPVGHVYLVHGGPGSGKTTLSLQFLREGVANGERTLYVSLLQTANELDDVLASHGWNRDGIELLEFPEVIREHSIEEQTLFTTAEVELHAASDAILGAISRVRPQRMVLDSVGELAVLVEGSYSLRRQLLKLKMALDRIGCTALFTYGQGETDLQALQTLVHGVIRLEQHTPEFGSPHRRLLVSKMRGMSYLGGYHDFRIRTGGLEVHPRIEITAPPAAAGWGPVSSGHEELDAMVGGGLEKGTSCLVTGTTGAGKSTLATVYATAAAERGERSVIFCFDEGQETFLRRSTGLGIPITRYVDQQLVAVRQVDVGEMPPGEFSHVVRRAVDDHDVKIVVIDSLSGYIHSMPTAQALAVQLHELLSYLSQRGVLTFLILTVHGVSGQQVTTEVDASYLADTVILMRHFEAAGRIRRCISVVKKRHGRHETAIRELMMGPTGIQIGPALTEFSGVLNGTPQYHGTSDVLLSSRSGPAPEGHA